MRSSSDPIEGHLVGVGGTGDGFDANAVDSVATKQISGSREDSLARSWDGESLSGHFSFLQTPRRAAAA
ncbi:MAG TPA: hypothetical protein VIQ05_11445 [Tardiphaga sp.]